ncbi:hypothetical protein MDOR_25950 [Mycolicibacterium doricum]|uniref:Uncharacterized protein n=1 Tax=Mycolicibacterium doricum TaxID=126673 RepID=A0A7I7VT13_9MYCO|nr:hypothetical protein MDOR_25950 [Mycolicibacterium doricum]
MLTYRSWRLTKSARMGRLCLKRYPDLLMRRAPTPLTVPTRAERADPVDFLTHAECRRMAGAEPVHRLDGQLRRRAPQVRRGVIWHGVLVAPALERDIRG